MESTVRYLTLDINPASLTTAQEKGVRIIKTKSGRCIPTFFKKKTAVENEKMLCEHLMKHKPDICPILRDDMKVLAVEVFYFFPYASNTRKSIVKKGETVPMVCRPDVDNISKAVIDCMTKCGYWEDDAQIVSLKLAKWRCGNPHIEIKISETELVF